MDASGNALFDTNWLGGVAPGGIGDSATFSTIITAPRIVTLDADMTVGALKSDSPISYTIAEPHALALQTAGNAAATIHVSNAHGNGEHTISAPIAVSSNLRNIQDSGARLLSQARSTIQRPTQSLNPVAVRWRLTGRPCWAMARRLLSAPARSASYSPVALQ